MQGIEVERPGTVAHSERKARDCRAEDRRLRGQIRPHRHDCDDFVARTGERLHRDHQRADAGRRDGDSLHDQRRMQCARVARQGLAQLGQTEVLRVEGLAALDRFDRRVAHEARRRLVALAEPECKHVVSPHAGVGDFANLRSGQLVDR